MRGKLAQGRMPVRNPTPCDGRSDGHMLEVKDMNGRYSAFKVESVYLELHSDKCQSDFFMI